VGSLHGRIVETLVHYIFLNLGQSRRLPIVVRLALTCILTHVGIVCNVEVYVAFVIHIHKLVVRHIHHHVSQL
jgi:hypothetical protein